MKGLCIIAGSINALYCGLAFFADGFSFETLALMIIPILLILRELNK
jgi:uncharacterized membrane protein YbjE (DUF340 family)